MTLPGLACFLPGFREAGKNLDGLAVRCLYESYRLIKEAFFVNPVDTLFVLICAAMALLMTPALAVFYAGLCRKKSGVDIMMQVWICLAGVGLLWAAVGFTLAFGHDTANGLLGGLDFLLLQGVGLEANPAYGAGIPFIAFFSCKQPMLSLPLP